MTIAPEVVSITLKTYSFLYKRTFGDSVGVCDGEGLLGEVRHHDDWRAISQQLPNSSAGVGHVIEHIHSHGLVSVTITESQILLPDAIEDVRALGHDLEQPSRGTASGILRGEEESENGLGDLVVGELAEHRVGLLDTF